MRAFSFLTLEHLERLHGMGSPLGTLDPLFQLAIQPPKTSHLRQPPSQRPQLRPTTKLQIRRLTPNLHRPSRRTHRRFPHIHPHPNIDAASIRVPLVSMRQHHSVPRIPQQEPIKRIPRKQSFNAFQHSIPARGSPSYYPF